MTWTTEDAAAAAKQGWGIFTVIDTTGGTVRAPHELILPASGFSKALPSAGHVAQFVRAQSLSGNGLALKALKHTTRRTP